ncbi:MAG TPA: hypothetical protein DCM28_16315 [Phycisphaerales bacterium]|nr:hypothetical protein [Phycisphaerales bacterium]HCD33058.1 hypothetical protein [Phycisphaerales bacterium]|tara:strand:+ start:347 stop:1114 length:768 start_codon:yes stop_codon:yes gene_type:complete
MKTNLKMIVMSCLLVATFSNFAQATLTHHDCKYDGTVVVRDSALSSSYYVDGTKSTDLRVEKRSSGYYNITTGALNLDIRNKSNPGSASSSWYNFQAYCIEKTQSIKFGHNPSDTYGYGYDVVDLSGYNGISNSEVSFLGKLWANAFDISKTGAVQAAAFQALVWEMVYDSSNDLDDDNFDLYRNNTFTKDVYELAKDWTKNITDGIWTDSVELFVLKSDCSQDFITTVPEPSSMALALIGGMMLLGRGRRQRVA